MWSCECGSKWSGVGMMILRVVVGLTFALHGWQKLQGGVEGVVGFFNQLGIPAAGFFGPFITWLELLGGIALIIGVGAHWAAKLLAINMIVAIFTAHISNGFFVNKGGVELPLVLLAALIAIMCNSWHGSFFCCGSACKNEKHKHQDHGMPEGGMNHTH